MVMVDEEVERDAEGGVVKQIGCAIAEGFTRGSASLHKSF